MKPMSLIWHIKRIDTMRRAKDANNTEGGDQHVFAFAIESTRVPMLRRDDFSFYRSDAVNVFLPIHQVSVSSSSSQ